jgi:hypothetical protein
LARGASPRPGDWLHEALFFYFEDLPGRRLRPDLVTSEVALEQAKGFREG